MTAQETAAKENDALFSEDDVMRAMREIPGYIDVTPGDFKIIFTRAYAFARKKMLHDTRAGAIMQRPAVCIGQDQSIAELIALLAERCISGVPVLNADGKVAGVVSEKDVLRFLGRSADIRVMHLVADSLERPLTLSAEQRRHSVGAIMSSPPVTVEKEATLEEIIDIFHNRQINRLPVVEDGTPLGVITRRTIINAFGRLM